MRAPRRSRAVTGLAACVGAIALGLLTARDCDAPDWQQALMLTVVPVVSGAAIAFAIASTRSSDGMRRATIGAGVGLLSTAASALVILLVWVGSCST